MRKTFSNDYAFFFLHIKLEANKTLAKEKKKSHERQQKCLILTKKNNLIHKFRDKNKKHIHQQSRKYIFPQSLAFFLSEQKKIESSVTISDWQSITRTRTFSRALHIKEQSKELTHE
jgi:hypothetical protein